MLNKPEPDFNQRKRYVLQETRVKRRSGKMRFCELKRGIWKHKFTQNMKILGTDG